MAKRCPVTRRAPERMGLAMDGISLSTFALFAAATFAASLIAGLAGFAFGLVAAAVWLYFLQPSESAALIVGYAIFLQGYAVWKLRHALDWRRLAPFIVGSVIGVPLGIALLRWASPQAIRG